MAKFFCNSHILTRSIAAMPAISVKGRVSSSFMEHFISRRTTTNLWFFSTSGIGNALNYIHLMHQIRRIITYIYNYGANAVDSVNEFIYLGSRVTTDGHSAPEVMRCMARIALAASAMNQLGRVWRQEEPKSCYKTPPVRVVRPVCPLVLR